MNRPAAYPGSRRGNNSRPHAKIATASAWQGVARFARHSLRGGSRGKFCGGARIVATATAWVHRGSAQLANSTLHEKINAAKSISGFLFCFSAVSFIWFWLFFCGKRASAASASCERSSRFARASHATRGGLVSAFWQREASGSISFDETSRVKSVWGRTGKVFVFFSFFCRVR